MITHQEAEVLTSARQDAPLDPVVERELQAHLATCDQCRAFAAATEKLTAGLRTVPTVAANPRVKREVMDRVRAGRGPFAGIFGGISTGFQPGPALAAVAIVAVIGLLGWLAINNVVLNDGDDGNNQIAAVPTESVTQELVTPTVTTASEPTATTVPEPTATTAPEPTATTAPEPTATTAPEPTATTVPEPTATTAPEPTATTAPEPTATNAPQPTSISESLQRNDGPADLTSTNLRFDPTPTPTVQPTPTETEVATEEVPTETEVATEIETETPVATEVGTEEATVEETEVPTPTPTAGIEPMDGSTSVPVGTESTDGTEATGDGTAGTEVPNGTGNAGAAGQAGESIIEPMSGELSAEDITTEGSTDSSGAENEPAGIELIDPDGEESATETPPESMEEATSEATTQEVPGQSIFDASVPYTSIVGDPADKLGLTPEGRMEFMALPDGASLTTSEGYRMQLADAQPGVVQLCSDGSCESSMESPEDEGWLGDVPLGHLDGTAYVMRMYGDRTEIYATTPFGTQLTEAKVISEIGPTDPPAAVYQSGGSLYTWLPSGQWLEMSGDSAQTMSGSYANPTNVRFAPSPNGGPLIGYFSGGTLIVAPVTAPDAVIFSMPSEGSDFDISPPGDQVAMIQGNNIVIYDIQGNQVAVYEGGDAQPGSVIWLNSGLVWVDRATGALYQIPETAN